MSQPTSTPERVVATPLLELGGPNLLTLARAHRRRQQEIARRAHTLLARLWRFVSAADPEGSWSRVSGRALRLMRAAMAEAARGGDSYVAAALAHQGVQGTPAELVAGALALTASDGRPLDSLLGVPAFEAGAFVRQGMPGSQALLIGGRHLERIVQTQVADAARVSTGVAIASWPGVRLGWIRMLTPPSCSRCIPLAGRFYRWNDGFDRHPGDDCVHVPASEDVAGDIRTDPRAYFDSLPEAEQDKVFTHAGAQAIRDGADISRVVNARRGAAGLAPAGARLTEQELRALRGGRDRGHLERRRIYGHDLYVTTEGTGRRQRKPVRLMPESIYEIANGDRDEAIRLLRFHGYIR